MDRSFTALIAGSGIGGLAAGLALQRAGWQVRIFERADGPRAIGFGLGLAPNAMAALRELGIDAAVRARAFVPARAEICRPDGRVLRRVDIARFVPLEKEMAIVLRPVLHDVLIEALGPDRIAFGSDVVGFGVRQDVVSLRLANGRTVEGDVLIGADGVGSVIRRFLFPDDPPPRRSGHWAIRGVSYGAEKSLGDLGAVAYLGDGLESATVRAGTDAIYWYVSLLAADLPADTRDPRTVLQQVTSGFEPRFQAITGATKGDDIRLDELFDRDPIECWGEGPVTLLGDAAHPMLPHTGQGAAQAVEDAVALGLALRPGGSVSQSLQRYEQVRARRTAAIVREGRRIARVTTTHNPVVRGLRDGAIRLVPDFVLLAAFVLGGRKDPHAKLRTLT
jgi:2-polyprenyl-6-methoxyphenol hydroxylase-like FAD-dependent oxidoreductase